MCFPIRLCSSGQTGQPLPAIRSLITSRRARGDPSLPAAPLPREAGSPHHCGSRTHPPQVPLRKLNSTRTEVPAPPPASPTTARTWSLSTVDVGRRFCGNRLKKKRGVTAVGGRGGLHVTNAHTKLQWGCQRTRGAVFPATISQREPPQGQGQTGKL